MIKRLQQQRTGVRFIFYTAFVCAIGWFDYVLGAKFILSLFYLIPVAGAAWFGSRMMGIYTALLSVVLLSLLAEFYLGTIYTEPEVSLWRISTRLGFFLITSLLISQLKETQDRLQRLSSVDYLTQTLNLRMFLVLRQLLVAG
jgi:K+-sensing histidine kinase KdpD